MFGRKGIVHGHVELGRHSWSCLSSHETGPPIESLKIENNMKISHQIGKAEYF